MHSIASFFTQITQMDDGIEFLIALAGALLFLGIMLFEKLTGRSR